MRATVTSAFFFICAAVVSHVARTVGTRPPQPISRMTKRRSLPRESRHDLPASISTSLQRWKRSSCSMSLAMWASLNIRTWGRASDLHQGQMGQFSSLRLKECSTCVTTSGRVSAGNFANGFLRGPNGRLTGVSFTVTLEAFCGARIVCLFTVNLKSKGARHVLLQQGGEAPHCQTSVFPWHSRTS